jgi:hypothetical protein
MMPKRIHALAAAALVATAQAQTPTATIVRVVDQQGAPIPHAVLDVGGGALRVSDDSGRIVMHFDADSTTVRVRRMGFAPFYGALATPHPGTSTVTLTRVAQPLAKVTVEGERVLSPLEQRGFYDRVQRAQRGAYNAEFVTPEELDSRPMTRVTDAFRGRKFIKVIPAGPRGSVLQGRAGCGVTVLLDGQPVRADRSGDALPPEGKDPTATKDGNEAQRAKTTATTGGGTFGRSSPLTIDDLVNIGSVAAIEMYASANQAPAELIPAAAGYCAIVAIWTGGRH